MVSVCRKEKAPVTLVGGPAGNGVRLWRASRGTHDHGSLVFPSSEIDAPFDGPKIEFRTVVRCKGSEVEFARLVQFAERILIVHR